MPTPDSSVVSLQEPVVGQLLIPSSAHCVPSGRGFLNPALMALIQAKEENEENQLGRHTLPTTYPGGKHLPMRNVQGDQTTDQVSKVRFSLDCDRLVFFFSFYRWANSLKLDKLLH